MKKGISIILSLLLLMLLIVGCGTTTSEGENKLKIVTTIFPEYDWVRNIVGEDSDNIEVTMLLNSGVDIHSYQPTAQDIVTLSTCDMLVYIGGESTKWIDDVIKNASNNDMIVVDLFRALGDSVIEEELHEGMESEADEDNHGDSPEYDEHIWLSLKNAAMLCDHIAEKIGTLDPGHKELYSSNVKDYVNKLNALDAKYTEVVAGAAQKVILFADRFPFRYMFEDYGIEYYAAFLGCSAETEASFKTIAYLSGKVDELGLKAIVKMENSADSIAKTIRDNTASRDQTILSIDSLQSTSLSEIENGKTYLSAMESNLEILHEALK